MTQAKVGVVDLKTCPVSPLVETSGIAGMAVHMRWRVQRLRRAGRGRAHVDQLDVVQVAVGDGLVHLLVQPDAFAKVPQRLLLRRGSGAGEGAQSRSASQPLKMISLPFTYVVK